MERWRNSRGLDLACKEGGRSDARLMSWVQVVVLPTVGVPVIIMLGRVRILREQTAVGWSMLETAARWGNICRGKEMSVYKSFCSSFWSRWGTLIPALIWRGLPDRKNDIPNYPWSWKQVS